MNPVSQRKGKHPAEKMKKGSVVKKLCVAHAYIAKLKQRQQGDNDNKTEDETD